MNCFDNYEELVKNDDTLFDRLLSTAESKLLIGDYCYESYSDEEIMTLVYSLNSLPVWDIGLDYWDMDDCEILEEDHKLDIISEYASRKLCYLIDALGPAEEIEKWYHANMKINSRMMSCSDKRPKELLERHADSLTEGDILALIEDSSALSLKDYQIASKFIRSVLCGLIDERGSVADIERWYRLFHLHCME